jgi:hydrogenase maturation protease
MNGVRALASRPPQVVILGLGNLLRGDDGVGVHFVHELTRGYRMPPNVDLVDGGTSAMDLLDVMGESNLLIVVDAMALDASPGTVARFARERLLARLRPRGAIHQIGLADALMALTLLERLPQEVVLIGIQPESMDLDLELTPSVQASLSVVRHTVLAELAQKGIVPTPLGV